MDIFEHEAADLQNAVDDVSENEPGCVEARHALKSSAVIALCTRLENVLRVVDGQDIATPFDGRMRHREMAAALTKLDEVRLWMLEHLRVRSMLAHEAKWAALQAEAQQAEQAKYAGPLPESKKGDGRLTDAEREALAYQKAEGPTVSGWTLDEIERCKRGFIRQREVQPTRTPPLSYQWHIRKEYDPIDDVTYSIHSLIPVV